MMPGPESVRLLAEKPLDDVALWLARGFYETARDSAKDPFAPHSFINLASHPAEGVEELYAAAPPELQRALRAGVVMLGRYCRYRSPESELLAEQQRLWLLGQFLRLTANLICIPAARTIASIASEDDVHWPQDVFRQEVFPDCCVCLQTLGLRFGESAYAGLEKDREEELRRDVGSALNRVVMKSDYFDSGFAPRTLAALISIMPNRLIYCLELLGKHVNEMHRRKPEQQKLSHLTATRIVTQAFDVLTADFDRLQIDDAYSRDAWLLRALFGDDGPLRYRRIAGTNSRIRAELRANPDRQATFVNEGLRTADLPPGGLRPANRLAEFLLDRVNPNFFNTDDTIDLHDWQRRVADDEYVY